MGGDGWKVGGDGWKVGGDGWRLVEGGWRWVEMGGGGWKVGGGGWRWVEMGGGGWRWVEVGEQFSITHIATAFGAIPFFIIFLKVVRLSLHFRRNGR